MVLMAFRVISGRERVVLDALEAKIKSRDLNIYAILVPAELKGYMFIEGESEDEITKALMGVPHVKGLVPGEISIDEIECFLKPKEEEINIKEGDIVEVIGGPFKREKAKVIKVDEEKKVAKIELIDSAVPIPISIKVELLKVIREE